MKNIKRSNEAVQLLEGGNNERKALKSLHRQIDPDSEESKPTPVHEQHQRDNHKQHQINRWS